MGTLFLKLANLSITACWMVLAVLLIRLIFRKAPKWIFCLLWGLVALRLICPISIESAFSLIPNAEPLPLDILYAASPDASANSTQIWPAILASIWVAGVAAMLLYELISYLLLRRRVSTATLLCENIKQSERVDSPFVLGLFLPVIYLPYSVADEDLTYIIAHEKAHICRKDHWWKPIGFILLAIYWFNPLLWVAYVLLCRDIETACDERVIGEMEKEDRRAYSMALLHCSVRHRTIAACPLAFGEIGAKSRIKGVMNYKKPAFWVVLLAVSATIVVAICLLTVPKSDINRQHEIDVPTENVGTILDNTGTSYLDDSIELTPPATEDTNAANLSNNTGYAETNHFYGGQTVGVSHDGHHSESHHDDHHH